jgi:mRNA interferase HicA
MRWNELRKIAEERGWRLLRHGANHDIYYYPGNNLRIQIGRHGKEEIANGTYSKLKKQIGF